MEHWSGNHDLTLSDLIRQAVTGRTASEAHASPKPREPTRINWDFGPEVPVLDFFESLDLSRLFDLSEAVENFICDMEKDEFRTWEAVIREEQWLTTMPVLIDLAGELISLDELDEDAPVHYINEIERLRTEDAHDDLLLSSWPRIADCIEQRARELSLPEGVHPPLEVVPEMLWLQPCCDPLCGLGQSEELTLAEEEQHCRIGEFLDLLYRHRHSIEFLGLTLDSPLERCELPERDRLILTRMVSDRLGLSDTDELLVPKLVTADGWPDKFGKPIEQGHLSGDSTS